MAAKDSQSASVASGRDHAHETPSSFLRRDFSKLSNEPDVVVMVVGVIVHQVGLTGSVTCGMYSGSPAQCIHFQPGIVRQDNFPGDMAAIALRLLARVGLEVKPSSTTAGMEEKFGTASISISWEEATPAKSRSLPGFDVAIRMRRMALAFFNGPGNAKPGATSCE